MFKLFSTESSNPGV